MDQIPFITQEEIHRKLEKKILNSLSTRYPRYKKSITLRSLTDKCIREAYFELIDSPTSPVTELPSMGLDFAFCSPIGDSLHKYYQDLLGLTGKYYTEKLMSYDCFPPLIIRTKADGFDEETGIFYEIKTKSRSLTKPYDEELLQCALGAFLLAYNEKVKVNGMTMIYVQRANPSQFQLFHYNLLDKTSEIYYNLHDAVSMLMYKMQLLNNCIQTNTPPDMKDKYIKKTAFGKDNCKNCVYRNVCAVN